MGMDMMGKQDPADESHPGLAVPRWKQGRGHLPHYGYRHGLYIENDSFSLVLPPPHARAINEPVDLVGSHGSPHRLHRGLGHWSIKASQNEKTI